MKREILLSILVLSLVLPSVVSATGLIAITSVSIPSSATQGDTFTITVSVSGTEISGDQGTGSLTLPSQITCTTGSKPITLSGGTGSGSWSCSASVAGDYTNQITASVTATDSGTGMPLSGTAQTGLTVLSPASLTASSAISASSFTAGGSVTFTVGVNNVGDSSTTFNISLSCPTGLTCTPSSVANTAISGGSLVNNVFTISGSTSGSYTLTATIQSAVQANMTTSKSVTVTGGATTTTLAGGGSSGSTEGEKINKTYTSITAGVPKIISAADLEATKSDLIEISITLKERATSVSIAVEKLADKPSGVSDVSGVAYKYIIITKENLDDSNVAEGKIKFRVEKSWITTNNLDVSTISLYRYSNNAWNKLNTTKLSEDGTYVYFEAVTPGFSYFAISGSQVGATTTTIAATTTTSIIPQVEGGSVTMIVVILIIVAIILIVAGLILFKPKKKSGRMN